KYADRHFRTLSEGERKRALIARAMMTDPELLILDEPGAGLDLAGRETLVRSLGQLASDPLAPTQILVTHHVEEIPPNFTHAMLLREGTVISAGPIDTALNETTLSEAFRLPLNVSRNAEGRFTAFARTYTRSRRPVEILGLEWWQFLIVLIAGFWAGTINSVVGSGTLVTFPVLVSVGFPPVTAQMSNAIGLVAAGFSGTWGYRRELREAGTVAKKLTWGSLVGGLIGATLLMQLPATVFDYAAPILIVFAVLFVV